MHAIIKCFTVSKHSNEYLSSYTFSSKSWLFVLMLMSYSVSNVCANRQRHCGWIASALIWRLETLAPTLILCWLFYDTNWQKGMQLRKTILLRQRQLQIVLRLHHRTQLNFHRWSPNICWCLYCICLSIMIYPELIVSEVSVVKCQ